MRKKYAILVSLLTAMSSGFIFSNSVAQDIAFLTIRNQKEHTAFPASVDLDPLTYEPDSSLALEEVVNHKRVPVPFQVEHGYHRFLWWMVNDEGAGSRERVFVLSKKANAAKEEASIKVQIEDGAALITEDGRKVLQYNYKTVYPPAGVDTVYRRSGFIHPLWSPDGHVLTRINPPDHYHHVGIWNPWTETLFQGKVVDFWNLVKKEGTVRFAKFISKEDGNVFGGFRALQEHVVLNDPAGEKVALDEVWDVRVYNVGHKTWLWDFASELSCATPDPVILKEYRYGGFGFRATQDWNNQNSKVLTSEGKTRKDADATRARWCMIDGDVSNGGHSGILFMDYPANYNFPEPMRVWPENMNGRGDVFFSFSPTRNMDWPLMPGKRYVLKYRMLVYDGSITPAQAQDTWEAFAHPPEVMIRKIH